MEFSSVLLTARSLQPECDSSPSLAHGCRWLSLAATKSHRVARSGFQGPAGHTLQGVLKQRQSTAKFHTLARLLAHLANLLGPHENFQFISFSPVPPSPAFARESVFGSLPSFGLAVLDSFGIRYY